MTADIPSPTSPDQKLRWELVSGTRAESQARSYEIVIPSRLAVVVLGLLTATLLAAVLVLSLMLAGIYDLGPLGGWWREDCTTLCVQSPGNGAYPPAPGPKSSA